MTLHIVNKSPFGHDALNSCLEKCTAGDALALIQDGVLAAGDTALAALPEGVTLHALRGDVAARGLQVAEGVALIDYDDLVALCVEHPHILSWY